VVDGRIVAVVGPTATGKSDLAVALAQRIGGEVVNADSMQLYRGMDIGTAKLSVEQRRGVAHHLLDVWPVTKSAAVAEYQAMARGCFAEVWARGGTPVLVGGSGLYVRGALDRLDFPGESPQIRARLEAEVAEAGAPALHARRRPRRPSCPRTRGGSCARSRSSSSPAARSSLACPHSNRAMTLCRSAWTATTSTSWSSSGSRT
jgi:tRNA dimethylallyltransferase